MTEINYYKRSKGFATDVSRFNKAAKILRLLKEYGGGKEKVSLLDIGTGNGEIAGILGRFYNVVSVDVVDQRTVRKGFTFVQIGGERLPFSDKSFDVIVSNHVIEHVLDADLHISEIDRVLKDDGLVYLATPNRLWPWEAHNRVLLLHYLSAATFNSLLKLLGRHHEDISLLSWRALRRKAKKLFRINTVSDRICKWPLQYDMKCDAVLAKILNCLPLWIYTMFTFIHPTLIIILKK